MRQASIERNTFETKIKLTVNLDQQEPVEIATGVEWIELSELKKIRKGKK